MKASFVWYLGMFMAARLSSMTIFMNAAFLSESTAVFEAPYLLIASPTQSGTFGQFAGGSSGSASSTRALGALVQATTVNRIRQRSLVKGTDVIGSVAVGLTPKFSCERL